MACFHPDAALLTAYSAGSLPEPAMLVVATHLAGCTECRGEVAALLRFGSQCITDSAPTPVSAGCRDRIQRAIACPPAPTPIGADASDCGLNRTVAGEVAGNWPQPLAAYLAGYGDMLPWKQRAFGMRVLDLPCRHAGYSCFLMDIEPGRQIPAHSHCGEEMVAVLRGAVIDPTGRFEVGDFIYGDDSVLHEQASDPDAGCVCLVVLRGDVDFRGRLGAVLNTIGRVQKLF